MAEFEDLTGNWIDGRGHPRYVTKDRQLPDQDAWLATNLTYTKRVNRWDGDTIRNQWTREKPASA